jgi:hypothetical protein
MPTYAKDTSEVLLKNGFTVKCWVSNTLYVLEHGSTGCNLQHFLQKGWMDKHLKIINVFTLQVSRDRIYIQYRTGRTGDRQNRTGRTG